MIQKEKSSVRLSGMIFKKWFVKLINEIFQCLQLIYTVLHLHPMVGGYSVILVYSYAYIVHFLWPTLQLAGTSN